MNQITQQLLVRVQDSPSVPNAGTEVFLGSGWTIALIAVIIAVSISVLLINRHKRFGIGGIILPVIALTLATMPLAVNVNASSITPYTEILEFTLARSVTNASGIVDLSGLFAEKGGSPTSIVVNNVSDPNMTIEAEFSATGKVLGVDISVPNVAGEYSAQIVYSYYMQEFTKELCAALPTWDGVNGAVLKLGDKRDERTYNTARLADGNCWMLNNLMLGSTEGETSLTPADSNINSNWMLPKVGVSEVDYYDQPVVDGPVPGSSDDIDSDNFYGFLYNWCAATAGGVASGGSNTCTPEFVFPENTTGDICPVGWRIPIGGEIDDINNEYSFLNARMSGFSNNLDATYISDHWSNFYEPWQPNAAWRGTFAGAREASWWWVDEGEWGAYWSSTISPYDDPSSMFTLETGRDFTAPADVTRRSDRFAIRCLLKM